MISGGVDQEDTLSDGTKLIYVSASNVFNVLDDYSKKKRELLDARFSTKQSLAIKGGAAALCTAGVYFFSTIEGEHPSLGLYGQVAFAVASLLVSFYPNYVDYKLGREYCGWDNRESHKCWLTGCGPQWGPDDALNEGFGVYGICQAILQRYCEYTPDGWKKKPIPPSDSGIVIVLRPRSKWGVLNTVYSGVYSQREFDSAESSMLNLLRYKIEQGK